MLCCERLRLARLKKQDNRDENELMNVVRRKKKESVRRFRRRRGKHAKVMEKVDTMAFSSIVHKGHVNIWADLKVAFDSTLQLSGAARARRIPTSTARGVRVCVAEVARQGDQWLSFCRSSNPLAVLRFRKGFEATSRLQTPMGVAGWYRRLAAQLGVASQLCRSLPHIASGVGEAHDCVVLTVPACPSDVHDS